MISSGDNARGHSSLIAREGWIFIFLFGLVSAVFWLAEIWAAGAAFLLFALFTAYFFRNPERVPPDGEGLIISPADGRVIAVSSVNDGKFTKGPAKKVSIFMSLWSVHVNRAPVAGVVRDVEHRQGRFFVASRNKASDDNERNAVILETIKGHRLGVVQIAGFIARRIVCYLSAGDSVRQGERLGIIKFGSRVDVYLPASAFVEVAVGEKVMAGTSVIGRFSDS